MTAPQGSRDVEFFAKRQNVAMSQQEIDEYRRSQP
jgi:hypothetical protein